MRLSALSILLTALAEPSVAADEIRVGQTMPYSGPVSQWGTVGLSMSAYVEMINSKGGVNGRKVKLVSLDDAYSASKAVEQTRKLVEQEEVAAMVGTLGTATNAAVQKYLNSKKIPQIFIASGASRWADPEHFPFTVSSLPSYRMEGRILGEFAKSERPGAKIGVLYQNDDLGKDYLAGLRDALGADADRLIVAELSYQIADPTVESQVVTLKTSGAEIFFDFAAPKFAAQAIRRSSELDWHPLHLIPSISYSPGSTLKAAGLAASKGLVTAAYLKPAADPAFADDAGMKEWSAFMSKYMPSANRDDQFNVTGYYLGGLLVEILKRCGDDFSSANIMRQVVSLHEVESPVLLEGVSLSVGPKDYRSVKKMRLMRFDGVAWRVFGEPAGD